MNEFNAWIMQNHAKTRKFHGKNWVWVVDLVVIKKWYRRGSLTNLSARRGVQHAAGPSQAKKHKKWIRELKVFGGIICLLHPPRRQCEVQGVT
ncbi:MAG: hypothetical protein QGG57_06705 [Candidatus Poseidoniia archaeon]|jgi:hypothetical protein|nr:hypothetical protein [Candidatus Poseidoniia archaeon]|tara:strand:+ start:1876 stop:2154 length:279 start_codon:yes stop_codon:yes gene_type:complete